MFFSARKKRWKISDKLGDPKGGFAYLAAGAGGSRPSAAAGWRVFDGKDEGCGLDGHVRCRPLPEAAGQPATCAGGAGRRWRRGDPGQRQTQSTSRGRAALGSTIWPPAAGPAARGRRGVGMHAKG
ncbi:unnamed protein product [Prorocentrum cordatum]|uniref:Uncharacterized protein n=1 Tax=Prorocentrum cordatum TaxID=2364126 RepID=A0ABN9RHQ6_9DINO|nr:unnamed protein product [Polarella glacialis]CAK0843085.1 unnamed protein product [Polarella glacialis]